MAADVSYPWSYILRRTLHEFSRNASTDLAASLTYFGVLSVFPALLALVSILGLIGQGKSGINALLAIAEQLAPGGTVSLIRGPIEQFASTPAIGLGLVIGIVGAIWSASGYVGAFGRALNRLYGVPEGRGVVQLRLTQLLVTLVTLILTVVIALILVLSGPVASAIGSALGIGNTVVVVWSIAKWVVLAAALVLLLAVLFNVTPNVRRPRFRFASVGAAATVLILAVATLGFGFYIANFGNYNRTYGSLAGIIIFLLWVWIVNVALLFGAQLDAEIERGRELARGEHAEVERQLPLKSVASVRKAQDRLDADILAGRRIRGS